MHCIATNYNIVLCDMLMNLPHRLRYSRWGGDKVPLVVLYSIKDESNF